MPPVAEPVGRSRKSVWVWMPPVPGSVAIRKPVTGRVPPSATARFAPNSISTVSPLGTGPQLIG